MQTKFRKKQQVKLVRAPLIETVEPYTDEPVDIVAGMTGEVNMILPNGDYHVKIVDDNGETLAYVLIDEDGLESVES